MSSEKIYFGCADHSIASPSVTVLGLPDHLTDKIRALVDAENAKVGNYVLERDFYLTLRAISVGPRTVIEVSDTSTPLYLPDLRGFRDHLTDRIEELEGA